MLIALPLLPYMPRSSHNAKRANILLLFLVTSSPAVGGKQCQFPTKAFANMYQFQLYRVSISHLNKPTHHQRASPSQVHATPILLPGELFNTDTIGLPLLLKTPLTMEDR